MGNNGLNGFSYHVTDANHGDELRTLGAQRRGLAAPVSSLDTLDPETAARRYLSQALRNPALPALGGHEMSQAGPDFRRLGTETLPLTGTTTVKFRQLHKKVPIYGSLVTVELDEENQLISINTALGFPTDVTPVASISPEKAVAKARKIAGKGCQLPKTPGLFFYFDGRADRWRLVYILEDVEPGRQKPKGAAAPLLRLADLVIDACTGELIAQLPRTPGAGRVQETGVLDGLNRPVTFWCWQEPSEEKLLRDDELNVHTHDYGFKDVRNKSQLPGRYASSSPSWDTGAVSAHVNAITTVTFLREVLKRNGLDDMGSPVVSSVNCVEGGEEAGGQEWRNAAWNGCQMVYGQYVTGGKMRSLSVALEVVAHELFHGVTDCTARLEYLDQSGALNESYSDVFGVIIANFGERDRLNWNWTVGAVLNEGKPLRDLSQPGKYDQSDHMDRYQAVSWDHGGVHFNSGIPNLAAYKIMTAADDTGTLLFNTRDLAALFYLALTQHLSRMSQFSDHRRAVELVAKTLFRKESESVLSRRLGAIQEAFNSVGIR